MTHDECSKNVMKKIMEEFKENKLKARDGKTVKNRDQALAIGLTRVESKCKYSKDEYKDLEKKVLKFVTSKPEEKIPLTHVIEARQLIEYFFSQNNTKKCKKYEILLWHYIVGAVSMNLKITDKIWQELKTIKKLKFDRY